MNPVKKGRFAYIKNFIIILPVVIAAIVCFFVLIRREIVRLSRERLALVGEECMEDISSWAGTILSELDIYQDIVNQEGSMNEHTFTLLSTSYGRYEDCPYGIYWGDKNGRFFDTSGRIPDTDFSPSSRLWYTEGLNHVRFEMGEPHVDEMTGKSCVSASARVVCDGEESVMAADVYLDHVAKLVGGLTSQEVENACLVTKKSRIVIADSDNSFTGKKLGGTDKLLYQKINGLIDRHFIGQATVRANGTYYVNINQIADTDWLLVICMNQKVMNAKLIQVEIMMGVMGVIVCVVLVLLTLWLSRDMKTADHKAKTDPLTGLFNRSGLKIVSEQAIADNPNQGMLLIMDMDNFKRINDQFGHPAGDEVLKGFAELLLEFFNRNRDYVARIGGDEFAVFIGRKIVHDDVESMLRKFLELFHQRFDEKYYRQELSVSIGIGHVINCNGEYDILYRSADEALYTAKNNGKNTFAFGA